MPAMPHILLQQVGFQCVQRWRHAHITLPKGLKRQVHTRCLQCPLHPVHPPAVEPDLHDIEPAGNLSDVPRDETVIYDLARRGPEKPLPYPYVIGRTITTACLLNAILRHPEERMHM